MENLNTETTLIAVAIMALEQFDNFTLGTFNNAIQSFGKIDKNNKSYEKALELSLINEDGMPYDLEIVKDASAFEVNRRVTENRFN